MMTVLLISHIQESHIFVANCNVCRTPLHKALFLGRLVAAGLLLEGGAQLNIQDHQVRHLLLADCRLLPWPAVVGLQRGNTKLGKA